MPISDRLLAAYENADYVVFGEPELVLHVGEHSPELDALMEADGATSAAYVTPANPRGEKWSPEENLSALETLLESLRETYYTCYPGEGRDPESDWIAEPSVLIVGIPRDVAEELGRNLGQLAIVFVEKGRAPQLVVL
jgi:hypothetical protein